MQMIIKILIGWLVLTILFVCAWARFWNIVEPLQDE